MTGGGKGAGAGVVWVLLWRRGGAGGGGGGVGGEGEGRCWRIGRREVLKGREKGEYVCYWGIKRQRGL